MSGADYNEPSGTLTMDAAASSGTDHDLDVGMEGAIPPAGPLRDPGAHSRFPGHALTPTGVMAIRCKQFHLPDL